MHYVRVLSQVKQAMLEHGLSEAAANNVLCEACDEIHDVMERAEHYMLQTRQARRRESVKREFNGSALTVQETREYAKYRQMRDIPHFADDMAYPGRED